MKQWPDRAGELATNQPGHSPDYFNMCRWKTARTSSSKRNVFTSPGETSARPWHEGDYCGLQRLFSEYGSVTP